MWDKPDFSLDYPQQLSLHLQQKNNDKLGENSN